MDYKLRIFYNDYFNVTHIITQHGPNNKRNMAVNDDGTRQSQA